MRTLLQIFAASVLLNVGASADTLYEDYFSGTNTPGWSRTTLGDNTGFYSTWSLDSSLESESGNQYANFDISITTQPSLSSARWYGGYVTFVDGLTVLPSQWELSLDVFLSSVEPILISLSVNPAGAYPWGFITEIDYWAQPADVGWQHVRIDQDAEYSLRQVPSLRRIGTKLLVRLASHDADGNPLTISQIGTYDFSLDNVILESVPEPSAAGILALAGALLIGLRRR